jgi:DNA-binding NarL/FixJ family response regulator
LPTGVAEEALTMKILLWCDDILSRTRIEAAWKAAGAVVLRKGASEQPDLVVMDLTAANALAEMERIRRSHPDLPIVAFGPHVDGDAFKAAKTAGATELVARGKVTERILLKLR